MTQTKLRPEQLNLEALQDFIVTSLAEYGDGTLLRGDVKLLEGSGITIIRDDAKNALELISTGGGVSDHGLLSGLDDDDHSAIYLNIARHDITARHTLGTVVPHDNLADLAENLHASLDTVTSDQHHAQSHVLAGADHTASGLTIGYVIRATGATTFAWAELQHGDLGGIGEGDHHTKFTSTEHDTLDHTAVASTIALDELGSKAHSELSDAPTDAHHAKQHDLSDAAHHTGGIEESDIDASAVTFAKLAASAKSQILFDLATTPTTTTSTSFADMAGSSLTVVVPTGQTADIFLVALTTVYHDTGGRRCVIKILNVTDTTESYPYGVTSSNADDRCSLVALFPVLGATGTKVFKIQWRITTGGQGTAVQSQLIAIVVPT